MAATAAAARTGNDARSRKGAGRSSLPPISVAKFREALLALDQVVSENTRAFIDHGQAYRAEHRRGTTRPLTADEVAAVAAGLGTDLPDAHQQIEAAGLAAYDEPQPQEILMAAVTGAGPVLFDAILRLTALVEMPNQEFDDAREDDQLDDALDAAVKAMDAVELGDQRRRAAQAWEHLSVAMGHQPGKAWGLIAKTIWQAVSQGMSQLSTSPSSSSTDSALVTTGPDTTSSGSAG